MNSFVVSAAVYDGTSGGTSGDPNPLVCVSGEVDGKQVFPLVFFGYLAAANAAGQMEAALTAAMFNWYANVYGYQLTPWPTPIPFPTFPPSNAIAVHTQGPYPVAAVSYAPALIGSWTA